MNSRYDYLIAGMGPVGLAAAFELSKKGKKVLIIEKREKESAALRPQMIVIDTKRKKQLMEMIGKINPMNNELSDNLNDDDIKFLDMLAGSVEIKLKAAQKFILNRIVNLNKVNQAVELSYETQLVSVELGKGEAQIEFKNEAVAKTVEFTHLVGADGAQGASLDLVNRNLPQGKKIERITPVDTQHFEETYHLGAYVNLSRKDKKELVLPEKAFVSSFLENTQNENKLKTNQLYFLRFEKKSHERSNKKEVKLGFIGEVPKEVFDTYGKKTDEEKRELALAYVKKAVADYLEVTEEELVLKIKNSKKTFKKNSLKLMMFKGSNKKAGKAAIEVNNHGYYLIGDLYFTPFYAVGHGFNNGLESAAKLPLPPDSDFSQHMSEYNKLSAKNANFARSVMQGIRLLRNLGGVRTKLASVLEVNVDKHEKKNQIDLKAMPDTREAIKKFINKKFDSMSGEGQFDQNDNPTGLLIMIDDKISGINSAPFQEWENFLTKNPSIVKQFRQEIWSNLTVIKQFLELHRGKIDNEEVKEQFESLMKTFNKYEEKINDYNQELIDAAIQEPNKMDMSGRTPLYHAVQYADSATIGKILKLGSDPDKAVKIGTIFTQRVLDEPEVAVELFKFGANPFKQTGLVDNKFKNSVFFSSLLQGRTYNLRFGMECLIACKDPAAPLYKAARSELSADLLEILIKQFEYHPKLGLSLPTMRDLLGRAIPEDEANRLNSEEANEKLHAFLVNSLKNIKNEKSFKFKMTSIFSPRTARNDAKFTSLSEKNNPSKGKI